MPEAARKLKNGQYYNGNAAAYPKKSPPGQIIPLQHQRKNKKLYHQKKSNPFKHFFSTIFGFIFLVLIGIFVIPFSFNRISKQIFFGNPYKEVKVDYHKLRYPTVNYLSNDLFLNKRLLTGTMSDKPEMAELFLNGNMPNLEKQLKNLAMGYKSIQPAVFVWDAESGKYLDFNAEKIYSAASIIKIPVLIQMFKSIEYGQFSIYDEMVLTNYYKASGSGNLQGMATGEKYTMDALARVMIENSDNSATNMIMSKVGSMTDVNQAIRNWGLKNTYVKNWLPDLVGENYTTAKDIAVMLYNLDNPGFLETNSRECIFDYMLKVKNTGLIKAGLPSNAKFIHKTGDIGKMLGDAGIVYTTNGKKYIVVILANRPYNSPLGKDFIQKASSLIYSAVESGKF